MCGPRWSLERKNGKKSRRSQISNPFRNAGGFLLQFEVGSSPGYIVGYAESPLTECESRRQVSGLEGSGERREVGGSGKKVLGAISWGGVSAWLSGIVSPRDGTYS